MTDDHVQMDVDGAVETYAQRKEAMAGVEAAADSYFEETGVDVGVAATRFNSPMKEEYVAVESDGVEAEVYTDRVEVRRTDDGRMTREDREVLAFAYGVAEDGAPETGVAVAAWPERTDRPPAGPGDALDVGAETVYDDAFEGFVEDVAETYMEPEEDAVDWAFGDFPA